MLTGDGAESLFDTRLALIGDRLRSGRVVEAQRLARSAPLGFFYPPPRMLVWLLWHEVFSAAAPNTSFRLQSALGRRNEPEWLRADVLEVVRATAGPRPSQAFDGPAWWCQAAHRLTVGQPTLGLAQHLRRRGESVGLAARTPFMDVDLARLALRLPPELGFNGTLTKPVLRAVSRGLVPDVVRLRPVKTLWNSLVIDLVAGPDWPVIRSLLEDPSSGISRFVEHDRFVREMLDARPDRTSDRMWPWATDLLRLAVLEVWLRHEAGRDLS